MLRCYICGKTETADTGRRYEERGYAFEVWQCRSGACEETLMYRPALRPALAPLDYTPGHRNGEGE